MRLKFIIISVLLVLCFAADLLIGSVYLSPADIFGGENSIAFKIFMEYRLPKAVVAVLAGMALSSSGLQMQTMFRNPLAGPYVLGISAGASLGVALFLLGVPLIGIVWLKSVGTVISAWVGAAAILLIIMSISSKIKDIMTILILGMMFGSAASAVVDILQYFSNDSALKGFVIWAMGSLGGVSPDQLWLLAIFVVIGLAIAVYSIKSLNIMLLGESYARTMGMNVKLTRTLIFISTSLLAGTVTAFCGPIGFLGIAVPHVARLIFRDADHRVLMPASMLLGATMMLVCDLIAQMPGSEMVLPINTVTALFGIPIVILVIFRGRKGRLM